MNAEVKLHRLLTEAVFVLSAVGGIRRAAERATGLMGGDWPGIDGAQR
jgi:hypothetical protein